MATRTAGGPATAMSDFRQPGVRSGGNIVDVAEQTRTIQVRSRGFDPEHAYRALAGRDSRFDGWFIVAVRTTGVYCRPSCPATTPKRANVEFFPTSAAAQGAGYRACRRCLPDAVPGSPEWNLRADLAARAMRLIGDGVIEREGVPGLASRLGYSERHVTRVLTAELGAGPLALARAHRAHDARLLIETTPLGLADVAFAAGFASVRQFNDTIRAVFATTPSDLRERARRRAPRSVPGRITVRLPFRQPFDAEGILGFLAARAIPGVEEVADDHAADGNDNHTADGTGNGNGTGTGKPTGSRADIAAERGYARTLRLPHGTGTATLRPGPTHVACSLRLTDVRDLGSAVTRLRRLFDLDADPVAVDELLSTDPTLAGQVAQTPGIRVPGSVDGEEIVLRALIGQQVSVAAARTTLTMLTDALGEPLSVPDGTLTRLFPTSAAVAERGAEVLTGPTRRIDTILRVSAALASGDLAVHVGRDTEELRAELEAQPGVGPWTAGYVLTRVLGAPDILLSSDVALRRGAAALGLPGEPDRLAAHSRAWQPWRSYAGMHLWRAAAGKIAAPTRRTA